MSDPSDSKLSVLFLAARSGSVRILGQKQLRAFADHVATHGEVIRNVEAYEVSGDREIPRVDLGLYQGSAEEADKPAGVRLADSESRLKEIVEEANRETCQFIFEVWTDEND